MLFSYIKANKEKGTVEARSLEHAARKIIGHHAKLNSMHADGVSATFQGHYYDADDYEQVVFTLISVPPNQKPKKLTVINHLARALGVDTLERWQKNYLRVLFFVWVFGISTFATLVYNREMVKGFIQNLQAGL